MPQPVLVAGARTPIGKLLGSLAALAAPDLGGIAVEAALSRAGLAGGEVVAAGATPAAAPVTIHIATPDAESFRRSEAYVSGLIARAVARGQRGL